jgi:hypothetical protein
LAKLRRVRDATRRLVAEQVARSRHLLSVECHYTGTLGLLLLLLSLLLIGARCFAPRPPLCVPLAALAFRGLGLPLSFSLFVSIRWALGLLFVAS